MCGFHLVFHCNLQSLEAVNRGRETRNEVPDEVSTYIIYHNNETRDEPHDKSQRINTTMVDIS